MPRAEDDASVVTELREHLTARCRATVAKLAHATECDLYDFSAELARQRDRFIDLETGRNVLVYRHEIPADMQPPRTDGQNVYTLRGDRLVPAEYQRGHHSDHRGVRL